MSEWTTEKLNAESVNALPKANVEGASLEDNKVPLIFNNGRKVNSYFNTCFVSDVNYFIRFKLAMLSLLLV
jgi:hypothetical protein